MKITKGARPGDIAAYLHGPGRADSHQWRDRAGREHAGGVVVGGNLGREGDTDGRRWAADLRAAAATREKVTRPIWQASLRCAPDDRRLSDREWAAAGQQFAESMGYQDHPWVMVRHADDHVHVVVSRVDDGGRLWADRHDYRRAQQAAQVLETDYGLSRAPRTRSAARTPARDTIAGRRARQKSLGELREKRARSAHILSSSFPTSGSTATGSRTEQTQELLTRIRRDRDRDRQRGREVER